MTKPQIKSSKLILLLSLYFCFALNISFWHYIYSYADLGNSLSVISVILLPLLIFMPLYLLFNLITVPYIGKLLIIILLILSGMADYAMQNLGIVLDSDMMRNLMETNSREALDLFTSHFAWYIILVSILPSLIVLILKVEYAPLKKEIATRLLRSLAVIGIALAILPVSYKEYVSFGRNHKVIRHQMNTFNYIFALKRYYKKKATSNHAYVVVDATPKLIKEEGEAPRVLVYLLGETARTPNFSLAGYNKETNPLLKKEDILFFSDVTSCGTATTISVPCMFSSQSKDNFKVNAASYTQNLLDIVNIAGYDVYWKDNDDGCKDVCNRIENTDARKNNHNSYCFGTYCYDEVLLEGLEERIANIKKDTLIVLHMMGSHGPTYYKRYPAEFKKFTPSCDTADLKKCTKEEIINTYDNTILYTDYIISSVINILKAHQELSSAMLFVSDHGESLGENNLYLHGLPYAIAPKEQKQVPMIMWFSDKIKEDLALNMEELKQKAANKSFSHDNLFHSILHLLSVQTTAGTNEHKALNIFN